MSGGFGVWGCWLLDMWSFGPGIHTVCIRVDNPAQSRTDHWLHVQFLFQGYIDIEAGMQETVTTVITYLPPIVNKCIINRKTTCCSPARTTLLSMSRGPRPTLHSNSNGGFDCHATTWDVILLPSAVPVVYLFARWLTDWLALFMRVKVAEILYLHAALFTTCFGPDLSSLKWFCLTRPFSPKLAWNCGIGPFGHSLETWKKKAARSWANWLRNLVEENSIVSIQLMMNR